MRGAGALIADAGNGGRAELLAAVEAGLGAALAAAGRVERLGPFDLHLVPTAHPLLRTTALPREEPADWAGALARLIAAARAVGCRPRVELVADLRPRLRVALARSGFHRRLGAPLLVARPDPGGFPAAACRALTADAPIGLLDRFLETQHAVFGEAPPGPAERALLRHCLERGELRSWTVLEADRPIATASLLAGPFVAELAGLWTVPDRRRRGHGRTVARAALAGHAVEGGRIAWAVATGAASAALLEDLGFDRIGAFELWETES